MERARYNELVRQAARHTPLPGVSRRGVGEGEWHWRIKLRRAGEQWRLFVGPGTVNDKMAVMTYLRVGDPRGWTMPPDHPSIPLMTQISGENFRLVDRKLTERRDPPHLLIQAPGSDPDVAPGDFERVPDTVARPPFFRSEKMWECELYRASVFLTAEPRHYLAMEDAAHFAVPTRLTRFRVAAAARFPSSTFGTSAGGRHELARLYLLRVPGQPKRDVLYAQQRCFWSLWTANAEPNPYGGVNPFGGDAPVTFGGLGLGFADAFAQGVLGTIDMLGNLALAGLGDLYEGASSVEFWTAA